MDASEIANHIDKRFETLKEQMYIEVKAMMQG